MSRKRIMVLLLVVGLAFAFNGMAFGNGGNGEPDPPTPTNNTSPLIEGKFTIRKYKEGTVFKAHIQATLNLRKVDDNGNEIIQSEKFFFTLVDLYDKHLCTYNVGRLKHDFYDQKLTEKSDLLSRFSLTGNPRITLIKLDQSNRDCNSSDKWQGEISGTIMIRVIP